jgi:hypothetical protein
MGKMNPHSRTMDSNPLLALYTGVLPTAKTDESEISQLENRKI